jgi:hypothetical protein
MRTNIRISASVILRLLVNLGFYYSLEKSDVIRDLLLIQYISQLGAESSVDL